MFSIPPNTQILENSPLLDQPSRNAEDKPEFDDLPLLEYVDDPDEETEGEIEELENEDSEEPDESEDSEAKEASNEEKLSSNIGKAGELWLRADALTTQNGGQKDSKDLYQRAFKYYRRVGEALLLIEADQLSENEKIILFAHRCRETADAYFFIAELNRNQLGNNAHYDKAISLYERFLDLYNQKTQLMRYRGGTTIEHLTNIRYKYAVCRFTRLTRDTVPQAYLEIANDFITQLLKVRQQNLSFAHEVTYYITRLRKLLTARTQADDFQFAKKREELAVHCAIAESLTRSQLEKVFLIDPASVQPVNSLASFKSVFGNKLKSAQANAMDSYLPPLNDLPSIIENALSRLNQFLMNPLQELPNTTNQMPRLRPHQIEAMQALRDYLVENKSHGWISMATGVGKTLLYLFLSRIFDLETLILVPSVILIAQTLRVYTRYFDPALLGIMGNGLHQGDKKIVISTYSSFILEANKNPNRRILHPYRFKLVILDEAHKAMSQERGNIISDILDNALVYSFTATPQYNANTKRKFMSLSDIHGVNRHIYDYPLRRAIADKQAPPCRYVQVVPDSSLQINPKSLAELFSSRSKALKILKKSELNANDAALISNHNTLNRLAFYIYQTRHANESAALFCSGIKHTKKIAKVFAEGEVPCGLITGDIEQKAQEKTVNDVLEGNLKVIAGVDAMSEGLDCPNIKVVLNLRPTYSEVMALQRGGRAARFAQDKTHFTIYDFAYHLDRQIFFNAFINTTTYLREQQPSIHFRFNPCSEIEGLHLLYEANPNDLIIEILAKPALLEKIDTKQLELELRRSYLNSPIQLHRVLAEHIKTQSAPRPPEVIMPLPVAFSAQHLPFIRQAIVPIPAMIQMEQRNDLEEVGEEEADEFSQNAFKRPRIALREDPQTPVPEIGDFLQFPNFSTVENSVGFVSDLPPPIPRLFQTPPPSPRNWSPNFQFNHQNPIDVLDGFNLNTGAGFLSEDNQDEGYTSMMNPSL